MKTNESSDYRNYLKGEYLSPLLWNPFHSLSSLVFHFVSFFFFLFFSFPFFFEQDWETLFVSFTVKDDQGNIVSASLANRQGQRAPPSSGKSEGRVIVRPPDWFHRINLPRRLWRSAGLARGIRFHPFYLPYVWIPGYLIPVFGSHFIPDANLQIENDRAKRGLPRVVFLACPFRPKTRKEEATDRKIRRQSSIVWLLFFLSFFFFFFVCSKQNFARWWVIVDSAYNRPEALDLVGNTRVIDSLSQ